MGDSCTGAPNPLIIRREPGDPLGNPLELIASMPEGMLVLGAGRRRVLAVNQAFSELTGRNPSDRRILAVEPLDLIAPEDHSLFLSLGEIGITQEQERVRLRILHESGEARVMEAQGRYLPAGGQNGRWVYFFRPLPNRSDREQILHDQVNHQKLKTMDAVKISLQIYQIAEKIRSTSRLSALLLNLHSEEELFQRAGDFLRGEGLNFRQVAILMLEGETLRLVHSSTGEVERTYSLREENRYSRFLTDPRENSPAENVRLVALSCRNKTVGVLELRFDRRERQLLSTNHLMEEWHNDILGTIAEIIALFHENICLYRELERQALLDPLTGIYNRLYLITQFENEVRRARRQGTPLSLIFTDLDHFKEVNDTLGHLEGDRLLKEVAELLRGSVRESDLVCRFGGDEFVIILPATDLAAARRKADELHGAFDEYPFSYLKAPGCDRRRVRVTVSVGVTSTRGDDEPGKILTSADTALYQAKRTGRDRVVVFEPSDPEPA